MVVFFLEGQDVATENLIRVEIRQELQSSLIVGVDVSIKKLSLEAIVSDNIMYTVNVFTFGTFVSLLSVIVRVISPQCIPETSEALNELTHYAYFLRVDVYIIVLLPWATNYESFTSFLFSPRF